MIINCGSPAMFVVSRPVLRPKSLASSISTEQLRVQLDQLRAEANSAQAKANSARSRLLRLSETVENLQRQAVINIQTGKENDARQLLFQKKMVMHALEKSKTRIELLDELSRKLNEAISMKETQLIGSITLDHEVESEDDSSPVHIVSPKQELDEDTNARKDVLTISDEKVLHFQTDNQASSAIDEGWADLQGSQSMGIPNGDKTICSLRGVSSYKGFLEHLDQQLDKIETELDTILNVSTFVLNYEEVAKNLRVQQTVELLESIRGIRQKIASIMETET